MGVFSASVTRPFQVRTAIKMTLPDSMVALKLGALRLSQPGEMEGILRAAVVETLLAAYRRRFLAALPAMINTRPDTRRAQSDVRVSFATRVALLKAYRQLDDAQVSGTPQALASAEAKVLGARRSMHEALKQKDRSRQGKLPTGRFRSLALKVLELSTDESAVQSLQVAGGAGIGIGNIAALDQILTPSATPELTGHPTSSTRNILWRQLEFGTGAFSTDKSSQGSRFRLASGGWWYGKSPPESLHLRGNRPGAMLNDPATQLPYQAESLRFNATFARFMEAALAA